MGVRKFGPSNRQKQSFKMSRIFFCDSAQRFPVKNHRNVGISLRIKEKKKFFCLENKEGNGFESKED